MFPRRVLESAFLSVHIVGKHHKSSTMSRSLAQRGLTLTEELEKLEQQITLTLQEIDSNFSKAHRIVTTSIIPIVEEYAQHSSEVWEGSKVCDARKDIS